MQFRPVELQASIPKTMEIKKIKDYESRDVNVFLNQFKKNMEQEEVILELSNKEDLTVDKDKKRDKKNSDKNKNKKKKNSSSKSKKIIL